nr:MAG TPA: hypothetical protein [Caudoviricetes sp.]
MAKDRAKGMLISLDIRQQVELLSNEEAGDLFKAYGEGQSKRNVD